MLVRALLLPIVVASAFAQPIPNPTPSECGTLLSLLSSAGEIIGLGLNLCDTPEPSGVEEKHAHPEPTLDDMDDALNYGDPAILPDWLDEKEGGAVMNDAIVSSLPKH